MALERPWMQQDLDRVLRKIYNMKVRIMSIGPCPLETEPKIL